MDENLKESFFEKPTDPSGPWDVCIIGSGPAGLTAGIYTTRGAASTLILGGESWGGQLMLTSVIDNFPGFPEGILGSELMARMKDQTTRFGAEFKMENVISIDTSKTPFEIKTQKMNYSAKTIIIATGAQTVWLGVPGEKELIGRGVSSCAPCDAPFFKDKKVAVVGGGDSAMEEALILTKYASEVLVIHRRDELKASAIMQEKVKQNSKIKIVWNTEVTSMHGEQKLEYVEVLNNKDNKTSKINLDGIFIAIGHKPDSDVFKNNINVDEKGFIKIFGNTNTNVEGVFVAGDVHDMHYKQAVTAAGFGCMAGFDALKYLENTEQ